MTKHTPTPWTLRKPGDIADDEAQPFYFVEVAPRRYIMAEGRTEAEANANALLCFDAPAMLKVLAKLCAVFDMDEHDQDRAHAEACAIAEARDLIAKHMEPNK
jgi:hypothetical protein